MENTTNENKKEKHSWIISLSVIIVLCGLTAAYFVGYGGLRSDYFDWVPALYVLASSLVIAVFLGCLGSIHQAILDNGKTMKEMLDIYKNTSQQKPDYHEPDKKYPKE